MREVLQETNEKQEEWRKIKAEENRRGKKWDKGKDREVSERVWSEGMEEKVRKTRIIIIAFFPTLLTTEKHLNYSLHISCSSKFFM